jgi:tetratricopeptide (TPR) repeat protein
VPEDRESSSSSTNASIARSIGQKAAPSGDRNAQKLTREQIAFLRRQGRLQENEAGLQEIEAGNERVEYIHARLRLLSSLVLAVLAFLVLMLVGKTVFDAWHDSSVVITSFDVPPDFDVAGRSGKVVASALLDRLTAMQTATRSVQASALKRNIQDAWSNDIKLEIPEAHVSIGEAQQYLRSWLGHETRISGSVEEIGDGNIMLTVRGNGFAAQTFTGKADTLPVLLTKAAEYIYGASQTYLFAAYLADNGRDQEVIPLVRNRYSYVPEADKPWLLNSWGIALLDLGQVEEAIAKEREAVRLNPELWLAWNNIAFAQMLTQQEEAALQTGTAMDEAARRGRWFAKKVDPVLFGNQDQLRWDLLTMHQTFSKDLEKTSGLGTSFVEASADAIYLVLMHDQRAADLQLETVPGAGKEPLVIAQSAMTSGVMALDRGDYAKALPLLRQADAAGQASPAIAGNFIYNPVCWTGLAEAHAGDAAKADADFARGGHLVDCQRFRADVTDYRGNWELAQKQYADAVALVPSGPSAYYSWGTALMRHGDTDGAIEKFRQAHQRGPHWADPLKAWGDALVAKGDFSAAVDMYEEAEKFAPNWGALHLAWGRALDALGKHNRAAEQYNKARSLDLSEEDRKSLGQSGIS